MVLLANITVEEQEFIIKVLKEILPEAKFTFFGSRVDGKTSKKYSDLDIALKLPDKQKIPLNNLTKLQEIFSNSDLKFSVDIVDYYRCSEEFQSLLDRCFDRERG